MGAKFIAPKGRPDGPIVEVTLRGKEVTNRTLAFVGAFSELEQLTLDDTGITDRGLAELLPLARLRTLVVSVGGLFGTGRMTDKGLEHIAALKDIEHLSLYGAEISDRGMTSCVGRLPNLKTLRVSKSLLTSKWLEALAGCRDLTELRLSLMPVGDSGLERFVGWRSSGRFTSGPCRYPNRAWRR